MSSLSSSDSSSSSSASTWPAKRLKLYEAHQQYKTSDGYVDSSALAIYIRTVGLDCPKQLFAAAIAQLDPHGSDRIEFKALLRFLRHQCISQENDKKFNRLLVKPPVGAAAHPTYDLPRGAHVYGKPVQRDAVSAKESIYAQDYSRKKKRKNLQLDVVSMNKRAVQSGYTTARQFTGQWLNNKVYKEKNKTEKRYPLRGHEAEEAARRRKAALGKMQFGYIKPEERPTMDSLVTGEFMLQDDLDAIYPKATGRQNVKRKQMERKANLHMIKHTKKSQGFMTHRTNMQAQKTSRSQYSNFTLRRFQNVKPRVNMTGHAKSAPTSPVNSAAKSILSGF